MQWRVKNHHSRWNKDKFQSSCDSGGTHDGSGWAIISLAFSAMPLKGFGPYIFPHTRVEKAFWICEHCSNSRVHTPQSPHPPSSIFHLITIMIDVETLWNFHLSSWKVLHCFHLPLSLHLFSWEFLHESRHFSLFFLTQFQGKFRLIRWD